MNIKNIHQIDKKLQNKNIWIYIYIYLYIVKHSKIRKLKN